jgi:hypothetical protein
LDDDELEDFEEIEGVDVEYVENNGKKIDTIQGIHAFGIINCRFWTMGRVHPRNQWTGITDDTQGNNEGEAGNIYSQPVSGPGHIASGY